MALYPVRADLFSPMYARHFATLTAAILHSTDAPSGITHLPCGVLSDTAAAFTFKDVTGTTVTLNLAAGIYTPISPAEITAASVAAVTVFWNSEP